MQYRVSGVPGGAPIIGTPSWLIADTGEAAAIKPRARINCLCAISLSLMATPACPSNARRIARVSTGREAVSRNGVSRAVDRPRALHYVAARPRGCVLV